MLEPKPKKVSELLDRPERWLQKEYAVDKGNNVVYPNEEGACQFCLTGAIFHLHGFATLKSESIIKSIARHLKKIGYANDFAKTSFKLVTQWNDDGDRQFEEVRDLIQALDL